MRAEPANGAALCVNAGNQNTHVMATDGAGGAIVAWVDARAGVDVPDIFAQHVLASGVVDPRWPANGFLRCVAAGSQAIPRHRRGRRGGAIVTWHDDRPGSLGFDVYALRVTAAGTVAAGWPLNGRAVCTVAGDQGRLTITEDGAHGAVVAWTDGRVTGTDHIFAHHVLAGGSPRSGLAGRRSRDLERGVLESRPLAIPDGAGGAIVTWQALSIHLNLYAQRVRANGTVDLGLAGRRARAEHHPAPADRRLDRDRRDWRCGGGVAGQLRHHGATRVRIRRARSSLPRHRARGVQPPERAGRSRAGGDRWRWRHRHLTDGRKTTDVDVSRFRSWPPRR